MAKGKDRQQPSQSQYNDSTKQQYENEAMKQMMAFNRQFMETNQAPELQEVTELMRTITGAGYAFLNLLDESAMEVFTVAVTGAPEYLMKISKILGVNLVGKRWPYDPDREAAIEASNLTTFENLQSRMGNVMSSTLVSLVEKSLDLGQVVVIKINKMDQIIGEFTLLMNRGESLSSPELADLFASQVGLFLDRSKNLEDLQDERNRLRDIIEATNVGTWEHNVLTGELILNERWAEMLGYTLAELQPTSIDTWKRLVHPEDDQRARPVFKEATAKGIMHAVEIRMNHKKGHWVWVEARGKVVSRTEDGKPLMMRGTHTDITERKEVEEARNLAKEQAEAANEAKSRYLSHMNHEMRTPLNGFLGFLQLMEFTQMDEEQQEYLNNMKQSASNLLCIINNVLDYAKIEAGEIKLNRRVFYLEDEMQTAFAPLRSLAMQKNLHLEITLEDNLPYQVLADPDRLRQIILNLGGNAIKFTEKGQVHITIQCHKTTEKHHHLQLLVEDTGPGMNQETLKKLFRPFYQADDGSVSQSKGTGLGLAITRELVELMGGEINIKSTPGEGTRVEVNVKLFETM